MTPASRAPRGRKQARPPAPRAPKADRDQVLVWEDDPLSGADPVLRPKPRLADLRLSFSVVEKPPGAGPHVPGSAGFRWWTAVESLCRGITLFEPHTGERSWAGTKRLRVHLDRGRDLNAYYDRQTLSFFHDAVGGQVIYSGESPDVVCHELGHALLDAVRPELWNVMAVEAAAFHEAFGDLAALLAGLELASLRAAVLGETSGQPFRSSRLSRLAESLGWAIRQRRPELAPPDCLRNAVNAFSYRPPRELPPTGPDSTLTSEPHSFSRVFTAGAFEALALVFAASKRRPGEAELLAAARTMTQLLVAATVAAPVVPGYYAQIANAMLDADRRLFDGAHGEALRNAFVRRGILSLESATRPPALPPRPARAAEPSQARGRRRGVAGEGAAPGRPGDGDARLPVLRLPGTTLGLGRRPVAVRIAGDPAARGIAAADVVSGGRAVAPPAREAARRFVDYLVRRGRVDFAGHAVRDVTPVQPQVRKTHVLVEHAGGLALERRCFDCGFDV